MVTVAFCNSPHSSIWNSSSNEYNNYNRKGRLLFDVSATFKYIIKCHPPSLPQLFCTFWTYFLSPTLPKFPFFHNCHATPKGHGLPPPPPPKILNVHQEILARSSLTVTVAFCKKLQQKTHHIHQFEKVYGMRTIITIVKADYCFMSQLLLNILSNVSLPTPAFLYILNILLSPTLPKFPVFP